MSRSPHVRSALLGAAVGATLAMALSLWMRYAALTTLPHEGAEGLTYLSMLLLGTPTVLLLDALPAGTPDMLEEPLVAACVVVNWSLLFWARSWFRRNRRVA